ncbi:MAG: methyltransferase domain-containing protein, partial [Pseudomonadota bacterium]
SDAEGEMMEMSDTLPPMSLEDVLADVEFRGEAAAARDQYRRPAETLEFFGLEPTMTVVEVSPGGGWYANVLVPYVGTNGGTYIAASYDPASGERAQQRLQAFEDRFMTGAYGDVQLTVFAAGAGPIAEDGSADMVLTFRNVHNWIMGGSQEEAFAKFYAALKPGGVLGVVEHRLPEDADSAMELTSGYVKESTVIKLAEDAGFVLDASSDINNNPADTADHPFGVWTLQPSSRTTDREGNAPEGFDADAYFAIGESDRMTLRFVKPAE